MDLKNSAISGVKWTTIEKIGSAVFQLLQIALLTRFLPKEDFGLVAMALVVVGFSNIFVDMGFNSAILFKQDATQKEYSSIYWLNLIVSVVIYSFVFFLTPAIASFYEEPELLYIIPILGTNILLIAIGRQHRTILQKQFKFKPIALIELSSYFFALVVAVFLAVEGAGVYSLVYSTLTASMIANILFLITNIRSNPISLHFMFNDTKPFLRVGGYQMGSKVLDFISKEADIFIIGKMLGAESLGVYSLSKQIVLKIYGLINPTIVNVLSPILSAIQNKSENLKQTFLVVVKYLAYINFPVYLLIIVGSKEILYYLYGSDYTSGSFVLSCLAIFYCISSLSNPVGSLQIATGRTDIGFYWTIIRIIITPAFIFIGALHSINGVALAMVVLSIILLIPIWYVQLRSMANISLVEYLKQFYKPLIVFILIGCSIVIWDVLFHSEVNFLTLLAKQILSVITFIFVLRFLDQSFIKNLLSLKSNSLKYID